MYFQRSQSVSDSPNAVLAAHSSRMRLPAVQTWSGSASWKTTKFQSFKNAMHGFLRMHLMSKPSYQLSVDSQNPPSPRDPRAATGFRSFMQISTCRTATNKKSCTKQFQNEFIITISHRRSVLVSSCNRRSPKYTPWKLSASQMKS